MKIQTLITKSKSLMRDISLGFKYSFARNETGASAVEFALLAPLMVATYLGMGELTQGMMASRRTSHLAATVGDLVAQSETLSTANIEDIYEISESIMRPLPVNTNLSIRVTNVTMKADNKAHVDWSSGHNIEAYSKDDVVSSVTTDEIAVGESLIVTEVNYYFESAVGNFFPGLTSMDEIYFHHPRNGKAVAKTD